MMTLPRSFLMRLSHHSSLKGFLLAGRSRVVRTSADSSKSEAFLLNLIVRMWLLIDRFLASLVRFTSFSLSTRTLWFSPTIPFPVLSASLIFFASDPTAGCVSVWWNNLGIALHYAFD